MATCLEEEIRHGEGYNSTIDDLKAVFGRCQWRRPTARQVDRADFAGFVYTHKMFPWGVAHVSESGLYVLRKRSVDFMNEVRYKLKIMMLEKQNAKIMRPFSLNLVFAFHGGRPLYDLSKLLISVEDAGNGICWADDMLENQLHVTLVPYAPVEGVGIVAEEL
jgi:hypothetical protein